MMRNRHDIGGLFDASRVRRSVAASRRANTLVLVVGILVLLVIIATGYLTRTHAGRVTATSQQRAAMRDDGAQVVGEMLADEIAEALFARPFGQTLPIPVSANEPRKSLRPQDFNNDGIVDYVPVRYGVDPTDLVDDLGVQVLGGDGILDYPYNIAVFEVVPFTNWQDSLSFFLPDAFWPAGPGNPNGGAGSPNLAAESNPLGNPGCGDSRWLADTEPMRLRFDDGLDLLPFTGDDLELFTHWRHLTNIARSGNGWRICKDISDVGDIGGTGLGGVVTNLDLPVEQFLAIRGNSFNPATDLPSVDATFLTRWQDWFDSSPTGYKAAYHDLFRVPPNFLSLRDLDGDGFTHNFVNGEDRPESEFVPGTARNVVSRVLADADGDGFTDSFWFLSPTMVERGIRQVVAVRVVDNSAMINVNSATRFVPDDLIAVVAPARTRGTTPADLALVGGLSPIPVASGHMNVGFYDNPDHWLFGQDPNTDLFMVTMRYDDGLPAGQFGGREPIDLWERHINELGIGIVDSGLWPSAIERMDYWKRAGLSPLSPDPTSAYTPYGMAEEIELRMFHGNNYPWVYSRLESSTQSMPTFPGILHAATAQTGSSEYIFQGQLTNVELVKDSRRKTTVYSGARNDVKPPWLWLRPTGFTGLGVLPADVTGDGIINKQEARQYFADMRKYDLRRPLSVGGFLDEDADRDGEVERPGDVDQDGVPYHADLDDDLNDDTFVDSRDHLARLRRHLERALLDDAGESYISSGPSGVADTQRMIASYVANIAGYLDQDNKPLTIAEAPATADYRYIGMEPQPFLTEAFVGHVYKAFTVPGGYSNTGDHVVYGPDINGDPDPLTPTSSVVVVQIANPFDAPFESPLITDSSGFASSEFKLRVFSDNGTFEADLSNYPNYGLINPGQTLTLYAMELQLAGESLRARWLNALGVQADPTGVYDVNNPVNDLGAQPEPGWSVSRDDYDSPAQQNHAIELVRRVETAPGAGTFVPVVIDRIDFKPEHPSEADNDFGRIVRELAGGEPLISPGFPPPADRVPPNFYPGGTFIGPVNTHWVEWVHVARAWDLSLPPVSPDQRNPRYVFSKRHVQTGSGGYQHDVDTNGDGLPEPLAGFQNPAKFASTQKANIPERLYSMQMLHKNGDFEQVGELLNVFVFGHELSNATLKTESTFSELMTRKDLVGDDVRVNRLRVQPDLGNSLGWVLGGSQKTPSAPGYMQDPAHQVPRLPAGARVLDSFVCDQYGINPVDIDGDLLFDEVEDRFLASYSNAANFSGKITPGLININTATPEVMDACPHWCRLVHDTGVPSPVPARVRLPQAAIRYRERLGSPLAPLEPDYSDRGAGPNDPRDTRGFASIGELMLLTESPVAAPPPPFPNPQQFKDSWTGDFGAKDPFIFGGPGATQSTRISTDVNDVFNTGFVPDSVAGDAEEANLLFAGASNLLTTRSDVFTVYFKVRSFRQNPISGVWDATDPEYILDDSRYVMLVDRSEVNTPNDKPKILYMEKLPR